MSTWCGAWMSHRCEQFLGLCSSLKEFSTHREQGCWKGKACAELIVVSPRPALPRPSSEVLTVSPWVKMHVFPWKIPLENAQNCNNEWRNRQPTTRANENPRNQLSGTLCCVFFFPCSFCPCVIYWQIYVGLQSLYFHDPCLRRLQLSAKRGASCVTTACPLHNCRQIQELLTSWGRWGEIIRFKSVLLLVMTTKLTGIISSFCAKKKKS